MINTVQVRDSKKEPNIKENPMSATRLKNPLNNLTRTANELVSYIETMDKKVLSEKMAEAVQASSTLSWLMSFVYTAAPHENDKSNVDMASEFLQDEANANAVPFFLQSLLSQHPDYDATIKLEIGSIDALKKLIQINVQNRKAVNTVSNKAVVEIDTLTNSTLLSESTLLKATEVAKVAANIGVNDFLLTERMKKERERGVKHDSNDVSTKKLIRQFEPKNPQSEVKNENKSAEQKAEVRKISSDRIKDMQGKLGHIYGNKTSSTGKQVETEQTGISFRR